MLIGGERMAEHQRRRDGGFDTGQGLSRKAHKLVRSGQSAGTRQKTYGDKIRWTKQQSKSNAKKGGLVRWGKS